MNTPLGRFDEEVRAVIWDNTHKSIGRSTYAKLRTPALTLANEIIGEDEPFDDSKVYGSPVNVRIQNRHALRAEQRQRLTPLKETENE